MTTTSLPPDERQQLLTTISSFDTDADTVDDPLKVFLPLPVHTRALERRTLVVRGERGAGKTALFHVLRALETQQISPERVFDGLEKLDIHWIEGFSEVGTSHPTGDVLDDLAATRNDDALRWSWLGHLTGCIARANPQRSTPPNALWATWSSAPTIPKHWLDSVPGCLGEISQWLDGIEAALQNAGQTLYVTYDHLDKLGAARPDVRKRYATSLLHLWLALSNRYRNLRPKIFLREDLFESSLQGSADASKLDSRSVSLDWNTEALFRMLLRHFLVRPALRAWLKPSALDKAITNHKILGLMPPPALPEEGAVSQRAFVERLAGKVMGAGERKGFVYRWIPAHLQDAHTRIVPRSLLNLIRFAADHALKNGPRAGYRRLLAPQELQAALEETSRHRVEELAEEHAVVRRLKQLQGMVVMADWDEVEQRLSRPVPGSLDEFGTRGADVIDELVRLGVLRIRSDGRVDVPDIYRYGYGIKRKGGVARPR